MSNPFNYGQVSYENQRGLNPYGYGCGNYGFIQSKPTPPKVTFTKGDLVFWEKKQVHATVLNDWKDYGVQISVEDSRGVVTTHRVDRDDLKTGITVLDVLSRI